MLRLLGGQAESCDGCGERDAASGAWIPTSEGEFGSWACENCRVENRVDPYSSKVFALFLLMKGGYVFGADELDIEDRLLLGSVAIAHSRKETMRVLRALAGEGKEEI